MGDFRLIRPLSGERRCYDILEFVDSGETFRGNNSVPVFDEL